MSKLSKLDRVLNTLNNQYVTDVASLLAVLAFGLACPFIMEMVHAILTAAKPY